MVARFHYPVSMMSTFRDILSDFESASPGFGVELPELAAENACVPEKPDLDEGIDGMSRWCSRCEEYWPLEAKFFARSYHKAGGFSTCCKACVKESQARSASKLRIPANVAGPLTLFFPEAPAVACQSCQRVYPRLGLFWRQDSSGDLTGVCASCKPITTLSKTNIEAQENAV